VVFNKIIYGANYLTEFILIYMDYLRISRASDLENKKERIMYRFFEILPGALSWLTLIAVVVFSWLRPLWMAFFIIAFMVYWFIRTIYFSFHLRACYRRMKEGEKLWLTVTGPTNR